MPSTDAERPRTPPPPMQSEKREMSSETDQDKGEKNERGGPPPPPCAAVQVHTPSHVGLHRSVLYDTVVPYPRPAKKQKQQTRCKTYKRSDYSQAEQGRSKGRAAHARRRRGPPTRRSHRRNDRRRDVRERRRVRVRVVAPPVHGAQRVRVPLRVSAAGHHDGVRRMRRAACRRCRPRNSGVGVWRRRRVRVCVRVTRRRGRARRHRVGPMRAWGWHPPSASRRSTARHDRHPPRGRRRRQPVHPYRRPGARGVRRAGRK